MKRYFADLHIHIGWTEDGAPVKISGSRNLTFAQIAKEASERKGMDIVGIIDSQSPAVQEEIRSYLDNGEMEELADGGIRYGRTTVLLGSELELKEDGAGPVHVLVYMPTLQQMSEFTDWIKPHMKNVGLSSQRLRVPGRILQEEVTERGGLFIPAHIFTPYRSLYGSGADRLDKLFDPERIAAVELGLSADTRMASALSELDRYPFLTNSDAHSLAKIGREYNELALAEPSFLEWRLALEGRDGRGIVANYGLNPLLGKYHRTYCDGCDQVLDGAQNTIDRCPHCGKTRIVRGVLDRIRTIADREMTEQPPGRPPYRVQVPLEYIPGLGPKRLGALLDAVGTEMDILHRASEETLREAAGADIASAILQARAGTIALTTGGGGRYGKVVPK